MKSILKPICMFLGLIMLAYTFVGCVRSVFKTDAKDTDSGYSVTYREDDESAADNSHTGSSVSYNYSDDESGSDDSDSDYIDYSYDYDEYDYDEYDYDEHDAVSRECGKCGGSGDCPICRGKGGAWINKSIDNLDQVWHECEICHGSGLCNKCGGSGVN